MSRREPAAVSRRAVLAGGGALIVSFSLPLPGRGQQPPVVEKALGKTLDPAEVDGFLAVNADGSVSLFCGKVDLGTGLRIAIPQMAAEELGIGVERIVLVEGDTALTPDQGPTAGSTGIMRGGVQIRQAAATARAALVRLAAARLGVPAEALEVVNGAVRPKEGGQGVGFAALIGEQQFNIKLDPQAPLKDPGSYGIVGRSMPRPDVPRKVTGRHPYIHDLKLPDMLHGRVIRPPAVGARLLDVDDTAVRDIPGVQVVRLGSFVGVVAPDEWDAELAARALVTRWSQASSLVGHEGVPAWMRKGPFDADQKLVGKGDARAALAAAAKKLSATYYWPTQSHASMGPSCAVADIREGKATIWSASQATHRFRRTIARLLNLPLEAVRVVYVDGSGCYGMNGHDDAAADAALLSRAVGKPVRVQWSRADELGWDPKGPPQMLALEGAVGADGQIAAWSTEMWIPRATANLPNIPLLGPADAGMAQPPGIATGLISQNGDPPYATPNVEVLVHWLKDAPLRPSNIRAPGKIANSFAVESFVDDLAAQARIDPVEFRLKGLSDPRGAEVIRRAARMLDWKARPSPGPGGLGRGIAYVHYKHGETYVAVAMEAEVDPGSGAIRVRRVACAQDCGLVINPNAAMQQVEGNILQTLSRTLLEEVTFDAARVTSVDWAGYPILTFPDVPEIMIDLVDQPQSPPLGVGEAASTPVPAALANAIFDATGARLRTVPFTAERVKAALAVARRT
ncbi:xanthine dehydrogenase family protein molybdopterin-binding subunit [Vineibacter terrae]|uniref:xanthine dehydrogenase family protein molybdopterin-binding subunit n=1 Tax=Vineibacter terrae TaxID=2586908 RepID=UPI002E3652B0|nr:molybdopterin cofactor-binding domain-containing protein [Vineibacter terrae]HEX2891931.1 molybdopterin cofactor-binding domain-containing protein [Vineibacter terrae]